MARRRHESEAGKQGRIADQLRQRIVAGRLKPGDRLPTQVELIAKHKVSGVTIQRALDRLARDGFIETQGRRGTFVVEKPPHLNHYALVFCEPVQDEKSDSRFYKVLEEVVRTVEGEHGCRISVYHGLTHDRSEDYLQLLDDARHHRVAGIVGVDPWPLHQTALHLEKCVPWVTIVSGPIWPDVPRVYPDVFGMVDRALDEVAVAGARRAAVLVTPNSYDFLQRHLREAAAQRNVVLEDRWIQVCPSWPVAATVHAVQLLMHGPAKQRPDVLLVLDDNLVPSAMAGLIATEMRVPRDVRVIALCNLPTAGPAMLPVLRIGVEAKEVLGAALSAIDQQRCGEQPQMVRHIPPKVLA